MGNCKLGIAGKTWTSVVNNFKWHLREIHRVDPKTKVLWCSLCQTNLGRQVATHACFKQRPLLVNSNVVLPYPCKQCSRSFPTWRGLSGHNQAHKKDAIQNDYNRRNNLPVAGPSIATSEVAQVDAELSALGINVTDEDVDELVGILADGDCGSSSSVNNHVHISSVNSHTLTSSVFNVSDDIFNPVFSQDAVSQPISARQGSGASANFTEVLSSPGG